ncbi:MAG: PBP1A family penicillin-binding protein [Pseudomonadota bacterium]
MLRAVSSFIGAIFSWVTNGAIMALLLIGSVFWIYGRDLPNHEQLAQYAPPTISRIYSREGLLMDEFAKERRIFAPSEEIPDLVKQAFISAEDKNFYLHKGYDPRGIVSAALDAATGGPLRGASTITQQVMKNFLLSSDRSAERKIKELILAARLEETLDKDAILELYLNEIFLGQNSFGVAAAAQTYFNKILADLEPQEAAYLAAIPKGPSTYHPVRQRDRAVNRRNFVLREMYENGFLTMREYELAKGKPLQTVQDGSHPAFKDSLPDRDYFTDEIRRQLSGRFGEDEFFSGGLSIRATVDQELQDEAARALRKGLEAYDRNQGVWRQARVKIPAERLGDEEAWRAALADIRFPRDVEDWHVAVVLEESGDNVRIGIEGIEEDENGHHIQAEDVTWARLLGEDGALGPKARTPGDLLEVGEVVHVKAITDGDGGFRHWSLRQIPEVQGAFMAMDVNTGRVLAMQGGFSYQHSVFNRVTQATRQPGSSFKPFVYAAALDSGYSPATVVIDAPIEIDTPQGLWRPKNSSNRFYGPAPLRIGIERSRNLMTVRLAEEIGMRIVADYAERFGVYDDMELFLSNSLGSQETTLFRMVAAYAMFANGGERVEPTLVDRVQDRWGRTVYRHDQRDCVDCLTASLPPGLAPGITSNRRQAMDAVTAYQLTSMMKGVVDRGTAANTVNLPVSIAGKTGTTNDAKDVWFVGFSSNIAAGCYIGYDQPRSLGDRASGAAMCGPVFNDFMKMAIEKYGGTTFKVPEDGVFVKIDRFTGERLPGGARGEYVVAELFRRGEEPVPGLLSIIDGGFAMGADLPMFARGEEGDEAMREIVTSTGRKTTIGKKANFGSLSSGGLY